MAAFVTALVVTAVSTPLLLPLLRHLSLVDRPNHRSSHSGVVPRGAGLACLLAVIAAWLVTAALGHPFAAVATASALVLGVVGLADDVGSLPPLPRLLSQLTLGAVVGWSVGRELEWMIAGAAVMALSVNTVNFMDGINGLTGSVMTLWGVVIAISAQALPNGGELVALGAAVAGSAIGFLPFNAVVPLAFLGDVGSYLFGGIVGAGSLLAVHAGVAPQLVVAPMSVYLVDVCWTLTRRARRHEPLLSAHREHIYQRLTQVCALPHWATTGFILGVLVAVVLAVALLPWIPAVIVCLVALAAYMSSPNWARSLVPTRPRQAG